MKINSLTKSFIGVCTVVAGTALISYCNDKYVIEEMKQNIKTKNYNLYNMLENETKDLSVFEKRNVWEYENKLMEDTMKTEGISKKAYFEGIQALNK